MNGINPFEYGMPREAANFQALTPLSFIERAATVYPDRLAIIHGPQRQTWAQTYTRCIRLASALHQRGIAQGETVAYLLHYWDKPGAHGSAEFTGQFLISTSMQIVRA